MRTVALLSLISTAGLCYVAPQERAAPASPQQKGAQSQDFGAILMKALKETKGCLGVDAAETQSRRNTIIAWFKDVESVKDWYHHEVHRRMVAMAGADPDEHEPLEHVKGYKGPVMVLATITPTSPKDRIPGIPIPVSQISVELFRPLPGGAHVNGRLSPKTFKVPHMNNLSGSYTK